MPKLKEKLPEKRLRLIGRLEELNNAAIARGEDISERILTIFERYRAIIYMRPEFLNDIEYREYIELAIMHKDIILRAIKGRSQWEVAFYIHEFLRKENAPAAIIQLFYRLEPDQRFLLLESLKL